MLSITRCINEHLVKDGNIHYGIITQMVKNEMIQWMYIPYPEHRDSRAINGG